MEDIHKAYKQALQKRGGLGIAVMVCLLVMVFLGIIEKLGEWNGKVLLAGALLIGISIFAGKSIFSGKRAVERKISKLVAENKNPEEFYQTIDAEMKERDVRIFCDHNYKLHLFITRTWFIWISANGSLIRRVSDLESASVSFLPEESEHALVIGLKDGKTFTNRCDSICEEIVAFLNQGSLFRT